MTTKRMLYMMGKTSSASTTYHSLAMKEAPVIQPAFFVSKRSPTISKIEVSTARVRKPTGSPMA